MVVLIGCASAVPIELVPAAPATAASHTIRTLEPLTCPDQQDTGRVRALLVGVDRYREVDASGRPFFPRLFGSVNDVHFLQTMLTGAGRARPEDVRVIVGEEAFEAPVFAALNDLVAATGCGDFVVFHFSGHTWHGSLALYDASRGGNGTVTEGQLRRAVTAIRNRGAFAFVHLDTDAPEHLELDVGREARWKVPASGTAGTLELGPNAGGYAGFHAGRYAFEQEIAPENPAGAAQRQVYGLFTFATVMALSSPDRLTLRDLAGRIAEWMASKGRRGPEPSPIFESTEPDRVMFATGRGLRPAPADLPRVAGRGRIEIQEPKRKRGVQIATSAVLRVAGQVTVTSPRTVRAVLVSGAQVSVLPNGRFEAQVTLRPGPQRVFAVAIFDDDSAAEDSFETEGPQVAGAPPKGSHRYALVIGNQKYPAFPKLQTPVGDARAVADLLSRRFGFETSVPTEDGKRFSLLLENAGRTQIFNAIYRLSRNLGTNDSVLIFYAGHGHRLEGANESYWLPVDAERGIVANWISAKDLSTQVKLLTARHVLIVSDSCFSGGLARGVSLDDPAPDKPPASPPERPAYVEKMASRTSRHLLASGANEPVDDGGGDGHSVFARAFLRALVAIGPDAFTGTDLFLQIRGPVVVASVQAPQYVPMLEVADEGGDFVFVRKPETSP